MEFPRSNASSGHSSRPVFLHLAALIVFAALTLAFTRPLVSILHTGIIGGPGDNLSFVWNFWWAQTAVATHQPILWTPALFAPLGTSLATHSYVPLLSIGSAVLFPNAAPLALYNVWLLASMFLNFACAYAAAWTLTNDWLASLFAGIVFGAAPFLGIRLEGHLNVLSAWGLPLVLALVARWLRRPTTARAITVAVALAAIAYTDYYYVIFATIACAIVTALTWFAVDLRRQPLTPVRGRILQAGALLLAIDIAAIALIAATGGTDASFGGVRIRMTDTFNARVIAGLLAIAAAVVWLWPSVRAAQRTAIPRGAARQWAAGAAVLLILLAPLLIASYAAWYVGDYSSQTYVWRNAPPGIDLASLALGNQFHPLTGALTSAVYSRFGINGVEGAAWLGIVPVVLLVASWRLRAHAAVRTLFAIGVFFFVWSLGPYLRVFNYNTGLMLPETLVRFVPIVANARVPGRAFAVVQLAVALLGASVLASLRPMQPRRATLYALVAIAGVLVDYWPAARQTTHVDAPEMYSVLNEQPAGIVMEVPLGLRDGFGEHGSLDERVLFYQTIHGHPQMGGFVARLSAKTDAAFESDPIVGPILRLSAGGPPEPPGECVSSLVCRTRYVVIDKSTASRALQQFVEGAFALRPIVDEGQRTLFAVEHVPACACR